MTLEGQTESDQVNTFVLDVAVEDIEVVAVVAEVVSHGRLLALCRVGCQGD
jgi:hypothetical protein